MSKTGYNVTNPIPASQIVDVQLNWQCLTQPDCPLLLEALQTLVDASCDILDTSNLDFDCFPQLVTREEFDKFIIEKFCELQAAGVLDSDTSTDTPTSNLSYNLTCSADTWDCDTADVCITVNNPCDPLDITNEEKVQALQSRVITLTNIVKSHCEEIENLKEIINTLDIRLSNIKGCGCSCGGSECSQCNQNLNGG